MRLIIYAIGFVLATHSAVAAQLSERPEARDDYVAKTRRLVPAAQHGDARSQTVLGFMYATGRGVPQHFKWLILAAAKAPGRQRDYFARIRDAVASKLTSAQIREAQDLADAWRPVRER
jgi:hypothetical protein